METPRLQKHTDDLVGACDARHLVELHKFAESLERELIVTESLLNERQRLLDAIPECELHGKCVPHALEWIEKAKTLFSNTEIAHSEQNGE